MELQLNLSALAGQRMKVIPPIFSRDLQIISMKRPIG